MHLLDNNFYYSVNEFEYKEKKIYHVIDEFINNPKKQGFLKVLSTAKLAEDIEMNLYFNKE